MLPAVGWGEGRVGLVRAGLVWAGLVWVKCREPRVTGEGDSGLSCEVVFGGDLLSHTLTSAVPSALAGLASGFGMGPGVSLPLWPP